MNTPAAAAKARLLLEEVLPDLSSRAKAFTVLSEPADPFLQDLFLDQLRAEAPRVRSAVAAGDWEGLKRQVHSFKGVGGSVGFPEISALCLRIEEAFQSGDWPGARRLVEALLLWQAEMESAP